VRNDETASRIAAASRSHRPPRASSSTTTAKRLAASSTKLLESVDKSDSAQLTIDEVLNPDGWILLSYVMDPRTGLAYHRDYRISNRELMTKMIG
jgi:hypothetical protein